MSNIIQENQLYTDAAGRAALVADKKLCMDALLINFFGFLGLLKLSDSRGPMKSYETTEGKLMLNNIGDTNHDVSLSVKLAYDAGLITMPAVNSMTKLLVLIKNKTVKSANLQEADIRGILDLILYKTHQPSPVVLRDITRFHSGSIGIGELAKELYTLVRTNKHLQPVSVEFRNLVMKGQYGDFFSKMGKAVVGATPAAQIAPTSSTLTAVPAITPESPSADPIKVPQYVNTTAGHNKFWAGGVRGNTLYTVWGAIGSNPQKNSKVFPDATSANAALASLKSEKTKKGYHENGIVAIYAEGGSTTKPSTPTAAPQPSAPVLPKQGATPEFFKNLLVHAYDTSNMNAAFKEFGVAKSTLKLDIFYQWCQARALSVEDWRQKDTSTDYESIPLIKHIKSLSGYKDLNNCLASAWVINSFKYALANKDADWFLNSINFNSFYKIIWGDNFGQGLPGMSTAWSARDKLNSDFKTPVMELLLSHMKDALREANTPEQLTQAISIMQKIRNFSAYAGNGLFGRMPAIEWKELRVTGAQLKLYISAKYYSKISQPVLPIKFIVGGDETGLLQILKKEVPQYLQNQFIVSVGGSGLSSVTLSKNVLEILTPDVQDAIKLLQRTSSNTTKDFFKVIEGDNIEATMKAASYEETASQIISAVKGAPHSSIITSNFDNRLNEIFGAPDDEIEDLYRFMIKKDEWVSELWFRVMHHEYRMTSVHMMLSSDEAPRVKAGKFFVRTLMEAVRRRESATTDPYDAMNFMALMLGIIEKKTMPDLVECEKMAMLALKNSPMLEKRVIGYYDVKTQSLSNSRIKDIRVFLNKDGEYVKKNPEAIGGWLADGIALPHGGIVINDSQKFKDVMNMVNGLRQIGVNKRMDDIKHAAELLKDSIDKFGWQVVRDYKLGDGMAYVLEAIYFFSAVLDGAFTTNFIDAMKANKESSEPNSLPRAVSAILNGMTASMQNKVAEINKPLLRAMFDLAKGFEKQLNNPAHLYLKTLSKDDFIKKFENGEIEAIVKSSQASSSLLDSLAQSTDELADTSPKTTIKIFELAEDLFKDKTRFDKSMRDSFAGKMTTSLFDIYQKNPSVANTIFMGVKGDLKRSLIDRATGEALLKSLDTHIFGPDNLVKPLVKITPERIKELLKYNSVSVTIKANTPAGKSITALEAEITKTANLIKDPKITHTPSKLAAKNKTEYLERKSVEYSAFQNYRHGDIALRFLDEFDVDIAEQKMAYNNWVSNHPGTVIMKPVFHGTGSVAATFILRFGFAVVKAGDPSCTGRMLGDGIYFSNVLDKATQYIGDSGFSRRIGLKGYILECEAALGTRGVDYKAAGDGQNMNHIRSPEWCVREKAQLKINKAFLVEMIDKVTMEELKKKYTRSTNEEVIMKITTFKEFIKESLTPGKQVITYTFRDGFIPISETEYRDFQDLDGVTFPPNTFLEPSAYGPMISIECDEPESEGFVVSNTSEFMQELQELQKFLRLAFNKRTPIK